MKSKDLQVNGEYLSCRTQDWESNTYTGSSHGGVQRIRVIEGPGTWELGRDGSYARVNSGGYRAIRGMLVAVLDPDTGDFKHNTIVAPAHIRGPWEPTWRSVRDNRARLQVQARKAREATEAARARVYRAVARIGAVRGSEAGMYAYDDARVLVDVETLEWVAAALEQRP